jgi:hypothetical protein
VLGDDHRGADERLVARILEHEEVLALQRVLHLAGEAAHRLVDHRRERLLVVGKVDGVEHRGHAFEARQVALLDVAQDKHGVTRDAR